MTAGLTLAVTSSTGIMGLAIGRVGSTPERLVQLAEIEVVTDRRHAEEVSPRLNELLDKAGVTLADLDRLVIDIGPGRFTGLRVGLATVRALGFALKIPIIGLTSLATLAAGEFDRPSAAPTAASSKTAVTAVIDARRGEVFQQSFVDGRAIDSPAVGRPQDLVASVRGVLIGDGVDRYVDLYTERAASGQFEPVTGIVPRASVMVAMSHGLAGTPGTEVEPLYLREPDAKPNIKTRVGSPPVEGLPDKTLPDNERDQ